MFPVPGQLLIARRRTGGWFVDHEKLLFSVCDIWIDAGTLGMFLHSRFKYNNIVMFLLVEENVAVFNCKMENFNFNWTIVS